MRITAGLLKGKKLLSPPLKGIRLTEEKVRKAIFDVLGDYIKGKRVLELFAGSGALGIEALSRGAKWVFFVDNQRKCIETIKKNIPSQLEQKTRLFLGDWEKALDYLEKRKESFDLIFLDPPYKKGLVDLVLKNLSKRSILLRPLGMVILEHFKEERLNLEEIKRFILWEKKRYGETWVSFLRREDG